MENMNFLIAVSAALVCIGLAPVYLYVDKKYRMTGREAAATAAVCAAAAFALPCLERKGIEPAELAELLWALTLLTAAACTDLRERIVPNRLIILGLMGRCLLWAAELLAGEAGTGGSEIPVPGDLAGAGFTTAVLLTFAAACRGALGFGDVKLLGLLSLLCGLAWTWAGFVCGMAIAAAVSLFVLFVKKAGRKYRIPLVPCFLAGFLAAILWRSLR